MKCSIMLHFIWVFTVCQSTHLGVSRIQRVKLLYSLQEAFWRIPPNLSALDLRNIVSGLALDENNVPIAAHRIKMKSSAPKPKQKEKKRKKEKKGDNDRKKKNAGKFAALRELVKKKADAKNTKRLVYLTFNYIIDSVIIRMKRK